MIRVAAVGDVHYDQFSKNRLRSYFELLPEKADLLLIAGDLTQAGRLKEAEALASDLGGLQIPAFAVLGNHDYHSNEEKNIVRIMESANVTVLEGTSATFDIRGNSVSVVGIKGFGGGFGNSYCAEFGEPETKAFAVHARMQAERLKAELEKQLASVYKFVLLHYAPTETTLIGERREIYPFLGSHLLGEAIDAVGADGIFHGHAHYGTERGSTPLGIPIRNVAQTVIRQAYSVYCFDSSRPDRREIDPLNL